jgi:hypothetical protein
MPFVTRATLTLMLTILLAGGLAAQETTTAAAESTGTESTSTDPNGATTTATETSNETATETAAGEGEQGKKRRPGSAELREEFMYLLRQSPPELAIILKLDPTLLSDPPFLARYPDLAAFVAKHPEVRHHSRFYLAEVSVPEGRNVFGEVFEALTITMTFVLIAFALAWLVRTVIEQKRWSRLSRIQTEVHNKILDRFGTSDELLQYIKSPAGTKFLESAPIPLHAEPANQNPSFSRVLWSVQIGVVVAIGAVGMLLVSGSVDKESAQGLFAMGVIGFCIGIGFIASAFVSIVMSQRLDAWRTSGRIDDSGVMR